MLAFLLKSWFLKHSKFSKLFSYMVSFVGMFLSEMMANLIMVKMLGIIIVYVLIMHYLEGNQNQILVFRITQILW